MSSADPVAAAIAHHLQIASELIVSQIQIERTGPVGPAPYVTVALASTITGLSQKAIRRKMEEGKWVEGREYRRSPDGGIFISIAGYMAWIERGML